MEEVYSVDGGSVTCPDNAPRFPLEGELSSELNDTAGTRRNDSPEVGISAAVLGLIVDIVVDRD